MNFGVSLWCLEGADKLQNARKAQVRAQAPPGGTYGDLGIKSTGADKSKVRPGKEPMYDHFFGQSTNRNEPNV